MKARRAIERMSPELALKIAAGEVVERPASAVKELLDNAIDAGATSIHIEIVEAGLRLIRVSDNGVGIPRDEVALAFSPHATSKIRDLRDLEHLTSLGFRGEALASIAAVSRVEIKTCGPEEELGTRARIEFGVHISSGGCSAVKGTAISVADLFANVPARRKFVRSFRAEGNQISQVVMQYSLAHPALQFRLTLDEDMVFTSPGLGNLSDAFAAVHGAAVLSEMRAVDYTDDQIRATGLISAPRLTRQNRTAIHVFVNERLVQNRSLSFALEEAYSGFLMTGRHPLAAIHLSVPASEVDVNVHPSKSEVRFARERDVHRALHRAVANALLESRLEARSLQTPAQPAEETTYVHWADIPMERGSTERAGLPLPDAPVLRVFGQSNQTFIIAEGPDGLYMIDQHAAHERILFDRFDEDSTEGIVQAQSLLEPLSVDLTTEQIATLEEHALLLARLGFDLQPFGNATCLVRSLPALARAGDVAEMVAEVLGELSQVAEPSAARDRALAMMACKAAVKAGQTLDVQEMRELVQQLERTARPSTCPHGRPTMIHLSHTQLEREFGRR